MALISCPECNDPVSSEALVCPGCGFKLPRASPLDDDLSQARAQEAKLKRRAVTAAEHAARDGKSAAAVAKGAGLGLAMACTWIVTAGAGFFALLFIVGCIVMYNENGRLTFRRSEEWIPFAGCGAMVVAVGGLVVGLALLAAAARKHPQLAAAERQVEAAASHRAQLEARVKQQQELLQQRRLALLRQKRESGQSLTEDEKQELIDMQLGLWKPRAPESKGE